MQLDVFSTNGSKTDTVSVSEKLFDRQFNEPLVHQVVVACMAGQRQGSHKQKTRAEVRGGGAKPWRQKGTGRARAGTIRSPLWRHGGVTFAAVPANYSQKINKKMYKGAILSILSQSMRDKHMIVVDDLVVSQPKTREMRQILKQLNLKNPLIIVEKIEGNENLLLAVRNIPYVDVMEIRGLDPVSLLRNENMLITKSALLKLNEALSHE